MKKILMIYLFLQMLFPFEVLASENNTANQNELILPGQYLKAVLVAYEDFQNMLKEEYKNPTSDFSVFLSKIENYEVVIRESEGKYDIYFGPKHSIGYRVRGGDAEYIVDKKNFRILKKVYGE